MGNDEKKVFFRTLDIYITAWLILQGFNPTLERQDSKVIFCFASTKKLVEALSKFNSGGTVEVSKFSFTIKNLKSQMFATKRTF